ncbi:MAG: signal peptidase II [Candidatus Saccharibacteria bacterium]|nr:signal peptidase II [Pseudorhodobacter sp.]
MKRNFRQIVRDVGVIPSVAAATLLVDQASKLGVVFGLDLEHRIEMDVLPPYLVFRMAWNDGVNFGLFGDQSQVMRWVLVAVALAISTWVVIWVRREKGGIWPQVSAGLLVGGALGNVIDRIAYGAVADFLNMSCCGIDNPFAFNIADVAVFVGAFGLVLLSGGRTPTRRKRTKTP